MKKVEYSEFTERYFDCPYCDFFICDRENCSQVIEDGAIITCPNCKKKIKVVEDDLND